MKCVKIYKKWSVCDTVESYMNTWSKQSARQPSESWYNREWESPLLAFRIPHFNLVYKKVWLVEFQSCIKEENLQLPEKKLKFSPFQIYSWMRPNFPYILYPNNRLQQTEYRSRSKQLSSIKPVIKQIWKMQNVSFFSPLFVLENIINFS